MNRGLTDMEELKGSKNAVKPVSKSRGFVIMVIRRNFVRLCDVLLCELSLELASEFYYRRFDLSVYVHNTLPTTMSAPLPGTLQLALKARQLVGVNKPARLYRAICK